MTLKQMMDQYERWHDLPDDPYVVMQALKEAVELLKIRELIPVGNFEELDVEVSDWLRKYGWKEDFKVAGIPVRVDPTLKEGEWKFEYPMQMVVEAVKLKNFLGTPEWRLTLKCGHTKSIKRSVQAKQPTKVKCLYCPTRGGACR